MRFDGGGGGYVLMSSIANGGHYQFRHFEALSVYGNNELDAFVKNFLFAVFHLELLW